MPCITPLSIMLLWHLHPHTQATALAQTSITSITRRPILSVAAAGCTIQPARQLSDPSDQNISQLLLQQQKQLCCFLRTQNSSGGTDSQTRSSACSCRSIICISIQQLSKALKNNSSSTMAMEVVQTINSAHEDALAGIAYNPVNKQIYTCAEGDKAIKVCCVLYVWLLIQLATAPAPGTAPPAADQHTRSTHEHANTRCGTSRLGSCCAPRLCTEAW